MRATISGEEVLPITERNDSHVTGCFWDSVHNTGKNFFPVGCAAVQVCGERGKAISFKRGPCQLVSDKPVNGGVSRVERIANAVFFTWRRLIPDR